MNAYSDTTTSVANTTEQMTVTLDLTDGLCVASPDTVDLRSGHLRTRVDDEP